MLRATHSLLNEGYYDICDTATVFWVLWFTAEMSSEQWQRALLLAARSQLQRQRMLLTTWLQPVTDDRARVTDGKTDW